MPKTEQRLIIKQLSVIDENKDGSKAKLAKEQVLTSKIVDYIFLKGAKSVFIYLSADYEVTTNGIIKHLLDAGVSVYVPVTTKDDMQMSAIESTTKFKIGPFGIRIPKEATFFTKDVDISVIPMVAFDKECHRLGHGKGYYDKFLKNSNSLKLGTAFEWQKLDSVCTDTLDVDMDVIITEENIYENNKRKI